MINLFPDSDGADDPAAAILAAHVLPNPAVHGPAARMDDPACGIAPILH
jgi:hypothetical protein